MQSEMKTHTAPMSAQKPHQGGIKCFTSTCLNKASCRQRFHIQSSQLTEGSKKKLSEQNDGVHFLKRTFLIIVSLHVDSCVHGLFTASVLCRRCNTVIRPLIIWVWFLSSGPGCIIIFSFTFFRLVHGRCGAVQEISTRWCGGHRPGWR